MCEFQSCNSVFSQLLPLLHYPVPLPLAPVERMILEGSTTFYSFWIWIISLE